jgi:23S rRNA (guanosine2251-2'-O)-methyltransferase
MNRKLKLEELNRPDLEQFKSSKKKPVVIVLDNIRSFNNVGSIFRTADAFAIEKIILCGITPAPPHRDIHKTALGATDSVLWDYEKNTTDAVKKLKDEGYTIASIEQAEHKVFLQDVKPAPNSKIALVFGHEVDGVEQEIIDMSDLVIEIPQYGTKHSINISVCAGIVMWEVVKKLS